MAKQRIKLEVEGLKLDPLKFFMAKENKDLEKEIEDAFDKLYEKYVPAQTREYIGFQLGETVQEETAAATGRGSSSRKSSTRSKRQSRTEEAVQNQMEGENAAETVEETVQESTMSQQL